MVAHRPGLAWSAWTIAALLSLTPQSSSAARPRNPFDEFVVCEGPGAQQLPHIVPDGAGGAFVTWRNDLRVPEGTTMRGQHFDAASALLWPSDGLLIGPTSFPVTSPVIAPDGAGGMFVAWERTPMNLYANRIDGAGRGVWNSVGIPVCTALGVIREHVVPDGAGGVIVVWADQRNGTPDLYAQRVDAAGFALWAINGVPVSTAAESQLPHGVVTDGAGGAIVLWWDNRTRSQANLYAQHIGPDGTLLWGDGVAITSPAWETDGALVADGAGGAIVLYEWGRPVGETGFERSTYARRLLPDGTPAWAADVPLSTTTTALKNGLRAVSDGAGGAFVVWTDLISLADVQSSLQVQRVTGNGTAWAKETQLATGSEQDLGAALTHDGASSAIVVWSNQGEVMAQKVAANGSTSWRRFGVPVANASGHLTYPAIGSDGAGGAHVSWQDYRLDPNGDLYARHVPANGRFSGPVSIASLSDRTAQPLANGGAIRDVIRFSLAEAGEYILQVFDATGRQVGSLPRASFAAGENRVPWSAAGVADRAGVYFYRLEGGAGTYTGKFVVLPR